MKFRKQIDFLGDLFVEFSLERRLMVSSANEIFGTSDPIPDFDKLAGYFRPWALTHYPALPTLSTRLFVTPEYITSMERTSRAKQRRVRLSCAGSQGR